MYILAKSCHPFLHLQFQLLQFPGIGNKGLNADDVHLIYHMT